MRKRIRNWIRRGEKRPLDLDPLPELTKTIDEGGWKLAVKKLKTKEGRKHLLSKKGLKPFWLNVEKACMHAILLPPPQRKKTKKD